MDERVVYTQYWQIYSCTLLDNVFFYCLFLAARVWNISPVILFVCLYRCLLHYSTTDTKFANPSAYELWKARGN